MRILRLRSTVPNADETRKRQVSKQKTICLTVIGLPARLQHFTKKSVLPINQGCFCSHLVAKAYEDAGCPLFESRPSEKVYPGALLDCDELLEDVTNHVLKVQSSKNRVEFDFIEDGDALSPHDREMQITRNVNDRVKPIFTKHGVAEPEDFYRALLALVQITDEMVMQSIDDEFHTALIEEGYTDLLAIAASTIEFTLHLDQSAELAIKTKSVGPIQIQEMLDFWNTQLAGTPKAIEDRRQDLIGYVKAYQSTGCKTFQLLANMQREICNMHEQAQLTLKRCVQLFKNALEHP